MFLVALSLAVLAAAPLLAAVLVKRAVLASMLDSFVLVTVGGIVVLHVVPESAAIAGLPALVAAVAGLFLPILLHHFDSSAAARRARGARDITLLVVLLIGTFVHTLFDGTALATSEADPQLAVGVILHRLPEGFALWLLVRPKMGLPRMFAVVGALAAGTLVGALVGPDVIAGKSASVLAVVQAFVGASILHVVTESQPLTASSSSTKSRAAALLGSLLALAVLFGLSALEPHAHEHHGGLSAAFLSIVFEISPVFVLSFFLVGLLTALYPSGTPALPGRGVRVVDSMSGVAGGLPHPLCHCAVAPLYTSLVEAGTSPASARAFLVAAPELGVPAILLSSRLLGLPFTFARIMGAALLAFVVGCAAMGKRTAPERAHEPPFFDRLRGGMKHGFVDAVDHVGPWILVGVGVAAMIGTMMEEGFFSAMPAWLQVVILAVAALPLYLCAAGATPIASALIAKGISPGAALAFLLVGPVTSIPTLSMLDRLHGRRAAVTFGVLVVGGAIALGVAVDVMFAAHLRAVIHDDSGPSPVQLVCALLSAALLLASLVRQGVRGFILQIMSPQHSHAEDHAHGPGCAHDHGPALVPVARVQLTFDPRKPTDRARRSPRP